MKYALTYTLDGIWDDVDTLIIETPINPRDMTNEELRRVFNVMLGNDRYADLLNEHLDQWFVRNAEDTDYTIGTGNNGELGVINEL